MSFAKSYVRHEGSRLIIHCLFGRRASLRTVVAEAYDKEWEGGTRNGQLLSYFQLDDFFKHFGAPYLEGGLEHLLTLPIR